MTPNSTRQLALDERAVKNTQGVELVEDWGEKEALVLMRYIEIARKGI